MRKILIPTLLTIATTPLISMVSCNKADPEPEEKEPVADFTYTFDDPDAGYRSITCSENPKSFIANKTYCFVMDLSSLNEWTFDAIFYEERTWSFFMNVWDGDWPDPSNFTYEVWMNGKKQKSYSSQTEEQGYDGYYLNPDVSPGQIIYGYHKNTKPKNSDSFHIYLKAKTDYIPAYAGGIALFFEQML